MKPLEYKNADSRATAAEKFFQDVLKFDNVKICRDYNKLSIITQLEEISNDAKEFDQNEKDSQAVNAVFVNWIGFRLKQKFHPWVKDFDADPRISIPFFYLTKSGEPIALSEYSLMIAEHEKTQVTFMQDF